jgi:hypothetical protein
MKKALMILIPCVTVLLAVGITLLVLWNTQWKKDPEPPVEKTDTSAFTEDFFGTWETATGKKAHTLTILKSGYALDMVLNQSEWQRSSSEIMVHLSMPKFDISAETDLENSLTALGLGDLFNESKADFSSILPEALGAHLGKTSHAARVAVDEEGITAAAYTVMMTAGAAIPPTEEVYFTLDRPFLFVISSRDNLPLFVGNVVEP